MVDKPLVRDSGDSGMIPLFDFMNSFVDSVFPITIGDFIDEKGITSLDGFGELDWQEYVPLITGVVICAAIGALFFVLLPLCGCCYCCCRSCCGCCQPQRKPVPPTPSACKKWTCCSILFLLVSCMFASVVCSYVAISMVNNEFSEDGVLNDLVEGLDSIELYLHDSVDDLDQAVFPPLNDTIKDVFLILDELPETAVNRFAKDTGIDPALYQLESYTLNLQSLNQNLTIMDDTKSDLNQDVIDMDNDLNAVQTIIEPLLQDCVANIDEVTHKCQALLDDVPNLVSDASYDSLSDVTLAIGTTQAAIDIGVPNMVSTFVDGFEAIENTIDTTIGSDVDEIKKTVTELQAEIKSKFDDFADEVKEINLDDITGEITDLQPDIETYASMGSNVLYGISAILLISVLLYLIGIPMGAFGSPQSAKHGGNCVLAAVAFTFIFGGLFMLVTMVMFVLGSAMQAGACRHLTTYDESMQTLEKLLRNEYGSTPPYNLTGRELLESCEQDQAIYTAFKLDQNGYNVSELLDLDNTDLPKYIDQLKNITIDIGTIEVINDDVNQSMLTIEASTDAIDFDRYLTEVGKPITKVDINQYAANVRSVADDIDPTDPTLANDLRTQATELERIHTDSVEPMNPLRNELEAASTASSEITTSVSLSQVMGDLTKAQDTLNTEGNKMVQEIIGDAADSIYQELKTLFDGFIVSIENDIAGCLPAYDALTTVIYGPCVYFLYPYNAVWFTYGWYLAFGFIAIFFATSVVGMFRVKAIGRKVSHSDMVPMSTLHVGYYPTNVVVPHSGGNISEPSPDYYQETQKRPASAKSSSSKH